MPWNETEPMNERVKFVASYLSGEESFTELCRLFGVSRKTGYKWVARYELRGVAALEDRSRAPSSHPNAISPSMVAKILEARKKHPRWGPRKLLVILKRRESGLLYPSTSTIGDILKRNGLIKDRRRRLRSSPYADRLGGYDRSNAIWCADFKGHFPVGQQRCHPLTISDGFSRYLLRCQGLRRPLFAQTRKVFESAFLEFGLPEAIRTDNGAPFSTLAPGGLSKLAVWWIRLGIRPERIQPGRPDQNGRHERMHGTLKAETARPPRSSFRAQQNAFNVFSKEYNNVRPHEALGQVVPASKYESSRRPYPNRLPEPEYPAHSRVAKAYPNGVISTGTSQWYISGCLAGEQIGLEEIEQGRWKVYFGPIALGIIDPHRANERRDRSFGHIIRLDGEGTRKRRLYKK